MNISHDFLVFVSKSYGLIYMMLIFAAAVVYALWPGNREKFQRAATSILEDDGPLEEEDEV